MLRSLYIENIAVIERAQLELCPGLNVLTGETGAGKSMVIDALGAVLGERVSRELVRTGCGQATVSAVFTGLSDGVRQALSSLGYEPDEDGSLLLQRQLGADGKGSCRIGGRPATVSVLREIGRLLVNVHGQHENQALLAPDTHIGYLDRLGELMPLREAYAAHYHRYCDIRRQLRRLDLDEEEKARRLELLRYQVEELESAALREGEEEALTSRRALFRNSEKLLSLLRRADAALEGDDEQDGARTLLAEAGESLAAASELMETVAPLCERVQTVTYELEECRDALREATDSLLFDESERDEVESRLALIRKLTLKYGGSVESALRTLEQARRELSTIESAQEEIRVLSGQLETVGEEMVAAAAALTAARRAAAESFAARVQEELSFLDMPRVTFTVSIEPTALTVSGGDRVEFLLSANPGEPAKPLSKIASGGELSRIMLAIKTVMADVDDIDTLVFDEIDTGISGRAANKVGIKLRQAASSARRSRQILCVTHLAQIAAQAHHHLLIEKTVRDGRTYTDVRPLDRAGRERELARIVSGEVTQSSLQAAREMLDKVR